jgi:UDPglucose 6-dehydrogenase
VRITVSGAGYAGLVTAACLADFGHDVVSVDIDPSKIGMLQAGTVPMFEPGLDEILDRTVAAGRLRFTTDYAAVPSETEVAFIVVGTPRYEDGSVDLTHVFAAVEQLAPRLSQGSTVVVKSTVPVGTTAQVAQRLAELRPGLGVFVAANPEFLRQGAAVQDFLTPERVVVGVDSPEAADAMRLVYQPLLHADVPFLFTTIETAELVKYASNAFLSTKLSFINEIADLCEASGAIVEDVARGIGLDSRIGSGFLRAGPGFGGACLPKDTQALLHTSRQFGTGSRIVGAALDVNEERIHRMVGKIEAAVGAPLAGRRVAMLGITFKADTDDIRESPAVEIVRELVEAGALVRLFDPQGLERAKSVVPPQVEFAADAYDAMTGADCVVIATEWKQFGTLDFDQLKDRVANPVVVDLRNMYDPATLAAAGIRYSSIGRRDI